MPIRAEAEPQRKRRPWTLALILGFLGLPLLLLAGLVMRSWNEPVLLWFGHHYVLLMRLKDASSPSPSPSFGVDASGNHFTMEIPGSFGGGSYEVQWDLG